MDRLKDKHPDYRKLRQSMVDRQIVHRGVRAPLVLDAMRSVPREAFLPPDLREFAYDDSPLPIEEGQTISQPYIVALMAEALLLQGGETVTLSDGKTVHPREVLGDRRRGRKFCFATDTVAAPGLADFARGADLFICEGMFDQESGSYFITERDAHTWVEVFFPEYGWIEFEPTAGESPLDRPRTDEEAMNITNQPQQDQQAERQRNIA